MEIYTPGSLEVLNGTDVRLKCTFRSREPVGQRLVISWDFQSRDKSQTEFVFHYQDQAYPPQTGRFSGRVTWDGNAFKSDASIMLWNVGPGDNGTFFCHIKNPPDVDGVAGEIELSVVLKGPPERETEGEGRGPRTWAPPPHIHTLLLPFSPPHSELLGDPRFGPDHRWGLCSDDCRGGRGGGLPAATEGREGPGRGDGDVSARGCVRFSSSAPRHSG
uniref:Myelin protein zero like 2 n=1 Tax=Anolis carolinensis TaxID=28377 RepID=A0A803T3E1_ANOCA